ncbi:MAG TPA: TetR/AcrR family transcriptional regulator [Gemmatimonadaceae bacterium]|nr:TetR/AcrR family transcriptional regulator [Gemmatimonadaceae bacterium]
MPNTVKKLPERAIAVAYDEFAAAGDISMRNIGSTLAVTAAALYHHFESKQALLDAVAERAFGVFDKRLRAVDTHDPLRTIRGILGEYRRFAIENPHLFALMFVHPRTTARRFPRDFASHRSAVFNLLWRAVDDLMPDAADGTPTDSLFAAHDLWALAHGQIVLWRAGRFENDRTFEDVFDRSIARFVATL